MTDPAPRLQRLAAALARPPALLVVCALALAPLAAHANPGACVATAKALYRACSFDLLDDWWEAQAKCINVADDEERKECFSDAASERRESQRECNAILDGRLESCEVLGDGRYDPDFDPAHFDSDFAHLTHPNPYYPLGIGNRWEYTSADETGVVEVTADTKLIAGVRCIVVRDTVLRGGKLHEDTDDWFAQAKDGTTWYCGEQTRSYETFPGDLPPDPELVDIDGSFKHGQERDKAGIIFLADPQVGDAYREEFSLANAEDATEVLSTTYSHGEDPDLDQLVPAALANAVCDHDCVVTRNYSLLEPDVVERKYYGRGIGVFLEVELESGEVVRLTDCNFDARCAALPQP